MNSSPALTLHDILTCVFTFVEKGQLPSSARVCKAWNEPVLDELWKELPSLFPLLDLLGTLTFRDGLDNPAWDRWTFYATRIRRLTIDDTRARGSRNSVFHPELLTHLRSSFLKSGGIYLIPKIQKLSLSYSHPTTASLALLFSDPSLQILNLSLTSNTGNIFSATRKVIMTLTAMPDTLKLREIVVQCWSDVGHAVEFDSALINFIRSQSSISALKLALLVNAGMLRAISEAISRLRILFLGLLGPRPDDGVDAVSALMSKLHPDLEHFVYYGGWILHNRSTGGLHGVPVFRSLCECRNLKTLTLRGIDLTRLDPVTIECVGRAWGNMERLNLLPTFPLAHRDGISTTTLQQIAKTFAPSLRYLAIPIAFEPGAVLTPPTSTINFPGLHVLEVGHSIIPKDSVHQFVEFLSALTPLGITVKHSHGTDGEQGQNWKDVVDLLQMIQRIKKRTRSELLIEQQAG
ncbi:hypothetical protein FRC05_011488 [Tulasnella sp. 425]|nr:hypothetical protein FRC05_011488 [Tulasnella sp. 425]